MQQGPKAVIAEDEPVLLAELRDTLHKLWPELAVVAEAADGVEAVRALEAHAPQILFLDIQMPGMSGLEVARQASGRCHVAFVTAYDKYAVAAFEEGAVDYVMKPFSAARLATTVGRLKDKLRNVPANLDGILQRLAEQAGKSRDYVRWITASQGSELRLVTVDEVCYFQADNKYTRVVTQERESLIRQAIGDLALRVDPEKFWRIHRGTIVNIDAVSGIARDFHGHMRVRLKARKEMLAVSERYAHRFRAL